NSFAVKGPYVYAVIRDFAGVSSVFRSSDNGENWQQIPSPIIYANEVFVSGDAILVAEFNFIWRSTDEGISWEPVEQFALSGVYSFAKSGGKIFAASLARLYTSTDNGATWTNIIFPGGAFKLSSVGDTIYLGNGKVSKSTDAGVTWNTASNGLGIGEIRALLYDGVNVFACAASDTSGVYISTNEGASWNPSSNGLPPGTTVRSMITIGSYTFAGMQTDGVYRSSNDGNTWSKMGLNNDSLSRDLILNFCAKDGILYAAGTRGIYKSTDLGITFTRPMNGFTPGYRVYAYSLTSSNNNIIAAVDVSDGFHNGTAIFYSTNKGDLWIQSVLPVDASYVSSVACDGSSSVYAAVYGESSSNNGLYKSTNSGVVFFNTNSTNSDIDLLAVKGNNVHRSNGFGSSVSLDSGNSWYGNFIPCGGIFTYSILNNFIFAGNCEGMFISKNQGLNWSEVNTGFPSCPNPIINATCTNNRFIFAAAENEGIWRRPLSDFGITTIIRDPAGWSGYNLSQNFPNPFNPVTKINFTIRTKGIVVLKIYDVTGKEVAVLLNEEMGAGSHDVDFDGSSFSSGIYIYKIISEDFTKTKSMLLIK
ncbi:MAG: T9SS type A sorting domain-containing protein, partial [Ignavibacteria bacterium]